MKNIFLFTFLFIFSATGNLFAQFESKRFMTGDALIQFSNTKLENNSSLQLGDTRGYTYRFDLSFGKFKTNTRAAGWRVASSLGGGKATYNTFRNNELQVYEKNGITGIGAGVGRFWQFYKHFNSKFGIYAGPGVDLTFSDNKGYSTDNNIFYTNDVKKIRLSGSVTSGLYYQLSPKWWATASLAFSTPIFVDYSFLSSQAADQARNKSELLNYKFSPVFDFSSVGFGVRYFVGK